MTRSKVRTALIIGIVGAALLGIGIGIGIQGRRGPPPPASAPRWLEFSPDEVQKKKMTELLAGLKAGEPRFPKEAQRQLENAKLFMYMAGTSEEEAVVLASLDAIPSAYSPRGTKKARPDRDLERVLVKRLRSASPAQVQAAFAAAPAALMTSPTEGELLTVMLEFAQGEVPALRWAALESLDLLPPRHRPVAVLEAFLRATEAEPALAVRGLRALHESQPALESAAELKARARQSAWRLSSSTEPGVRGTALLVLVDLDPNTPGKVTAMARRFLADPHPYVRGMAAAGLSVGKLGDETDVHRLMPLVEDFAEARTTLAGPARLDGTPVEVSFNVPGRRLVAESALFSVQRLAMGPPPGPLLPDQKPITWEAPPVLTIGGRAGGLELVQANAARMRAWYEAEKTRLPQAK